jgi:PKD repeat protein
MYPTFYEFNVAAQTSPGLWITCLHWDFGDGSTLNVPYSTRSYVSEARYHQYAQPGVYTVAVTAYDNMGNYGTAQIIVIWTI